MDSPAWFFVVIALLTYALKLIFTSFLAVVTLCVALLPLSIDVGMSPWITAMIILIASEVWFFPYRVDSEANPAGTGTSNNSDGIKGIFRAGCSVSRSNVPFPLR